MEARMATPWALEVHLDARFTGDSVSEVLEYLRSAPAGTSLLLLDASLVKEFDMASAMARLSTLSEVRSRGVERVVVVLEHLFAGPVAEQIRQATGVYVRLFAQRKAAYQWILDGCPD